jgi:hypothetical protein
MKPEIDNLNATVPDENLSMETRNEYLKKGH